MLTGRKAHSIYSMKSHNIDSLTPNSLAEPEIFSQKIERIPKNNEDLLKMLQNGEAVATTAIYFENKDPVCFIDVRGQENMVPEFATPAPLEFPSSIAPQQVLRHCSINKRKKLAYIAQGFVPEGTKVAGGWIKGIVTLATCFIAFTEMTRDYPEENLSMRTIILLATLTSIAAIGAIGEGILSNGEMNLPRASHEELNPKKLKRSIGGRIFGGMAIGYLACGGVGYIIEM